MPFINLILPKTQGLSGIRTATMHQLPTPGLSPLGLLIQTDRKVRMNDQLKIMLGPKIYIFFQHFTIYIFSGKPKNGIT